MSRFSSMLDGVRAVFTFSKLLDRRGWRLFFLYLAIACVAVGGFAALVFYLKPALKNAMLEYVFPEHWRLAGRLLVEKYFGRLGSQALANVIIVGGMSALSTLCCLVKEILSRNIEHSRPLLQESHAPWPLWRQVVEEFKFGLFYLLTYNLIYWIGYPPYPFARTLSTVLSYLALFVFFNITFLCPLFLRHRVGYGRMVRTFLARPIQSFSFAAIFCAPALVAAQFVEGANIGVAVAVLLAAHVIVVAPAATGGTLLAAKLLPIAKAMRAVPLFFRLVGWAILFLALAVSAAVSWRLIDSLHKKTQVLKCEYKIDTSTLTLDPPSFTDLSVGLSFDLEVRNPTEVDVLLESSRLEISNNNRPFSTVHLSRIEVPAGQIRRQTVSLKLEVTLARILEYRELLDKPWDFVLWVKVAEGWEFPVFFR